MREKGGPQNFKLKKWKEKPKEFKYSSRKTMKKVSHTQKDKKRREYKRYQR